jgi:hypothetical protein
MKQPRKIFIVPADDPTEKPSKKYSLAEIERVLRAFDREQQPLKDFRRKKGNQK